MNKDYMSNKLEQYHFMLIYSIAFVLASILSISMGDFFDKTANIYIFLLFLIPQLCYITISAVIIYSLKIDFKILEKKNIKLSSYIYSICLGLGVFFVFLLPNHYLNLLFERLNLTANVILPTFNRFDDYLFGIILICLLPAIGEELVFRKILCDSLNDISQWKIIILSGAIFSFTHFNLAQTFYQFFIGCVLAYLYVTTKNITLTMIIHFINNILALFITSITGTAMWNNIITLAISCVIGAILLLGSLYFIKKSHPPLQKSNSKLSIITYVFLFIIVMLWLITVIMSF